MSRKSKIVLSLAFITILSFSVFFFVFNGGFAGNVDRVNKEYAELVNVTSMNGHFLILSNGSSLDVDDIWIDVDNPIEVIVDDNLENIEFSARPVFRHRIYGSRVFYLASSLTVFVPNEGQKLMWEVFLESAREKNYSYEIYKIKN